MQPFHFLKAFHFLVLEQLSLSFKNRYSNPLNQRERARENKKELTENLYLFITATFALAPLSYFISLSLSLYIYILSLSLSFYIYSFSLSFTLLLWIPSSLIIFHQLLSLLEESNEEVVKKHFHVCPAHSLRYNSNHVSKRWTYLISWNIHNFNLCLDILITCNRVVIQKICKKRGKIECESEMDFFKEQKIYSKWET